MNARAYFYLGITALFWGGNSVAGKMAVGHVSPMMLTTLRWLLALAVILVLMTPQIRRDWQKIRQHWLQLLAYGAVGFTMLMRSCIPRCNTPAPSMPSSFRPAFRC